VSGNDERPRQAVLDYSVGCLGQLLRSRGTKDKLSCAGLQGRLHILSRDKYAYRSCSRPDSYFSTMSCHKCRPLVSMDALYAAAAGDTQSLSEEKASVNPCKSTEVNGK